jgi:hypothetical protein
MEESYQPIGPKDRHVCRPGCQCQQCEESRRQTEVLKARFLVALVTTSPANPNQVPT